MSPSDPPVAAPTPHQQAVDDATAQLLIELAFLVPLGTNLNTHPIAKRLKDFQCAIEARARVAAPTPPQDLVRRLTEWLAAGGFFNPAEMTCANENATRELILDVRDALLRVAAPTPETPSLNYFDPEHPPQNCDAKLWRLICLRVHALHEENERLRARVAATTPPDVTKEEFVRQVKDEALRLQRAYKLSSAAALQEAFHRFEPFRVPERAAPTPETPSQWKWDYSFAAEAITAFLKMGVCPHGYDREDLQRFAERLAGAVSHPQPDPRPTKDDK